MIILQCNEEPAILDTVYAITIKLAYIKGQSDPVFIVNPDKSTSIRHPEIVGRQPPLSLVVKVLREAADSVEQLNVSFS